MPVARKWLRIGPRFTTRETFRGERAGNRIAQIIPCRAARAAGAKQIFTNPRRLQQGAPLIGASRRFLAMFERRPLELSEDKFGMRLDHPRHKLWISAQGAVDF